MNFKLHISNAWLLIAIVFFSASSDANPLAAWAPDETVLYRGIKVPDQLDLGRIFFAHGNGSVVLPSEPAQLTTVIIRHKDGLRSQGDGLVSSTTDIAVATMFSDTTYSGGRGLIVKFQVPPNSVSLNKFAADALGKSHDHGALHGFEYEKEVIFPDPLPGKSVIEVIEVVPSGSQKTLTPKKPDSLNYPFAIRKWRLDTNGKIIEEPIQPPQRLPIYYGGREIL